MNRVLVCALETQVCVFPASESIFNSDMSFI